MREIKFRGKRVDNGEWVCGYLLEKWAGKDKPRRFVIDPCNSFYEDGWTSWPDDVVEVIPASVGQFTGLYDKNGVEMYEGDIVEGITLDESVLGDNILFSREIKVRCQVKWSKHEVMFYFYCRQFKRLLSIVDEFFDLEVIGNRYENTSLLEV